MFKLQLFKGNNGQKRQVRRDSCDSLRFQDLVLRVLVVVTVLWAAQVLKDGYKEQLGEDHIQGTETGTMLNPH